MNEKKYNEKYNFPKSWDKIKNNTNTKNSFVVEPFNEGAVICFYKNGIQWKMEGISFKDLFDFLPMLRSMNYIENLVIDNLANYIDTENNKYL